jgi:hypothetical protein
VGGLRRQHNGELHNMYPSPNNVRVIKLRMRWAEHVAFMGETRNTYNIFVEKPKCKGSLGRPRRMGDNNIRIDLR